MKEGRKEVRSLLSGGLFNARGSAFAGPCIAGHLLEPRSSQGSKFGCGGGREGAQGERTYGIVPRQRIRGQDEEVAQVVRP